MNYLVSHKKNLILPIISLLLPHVIVPAPTPTEAMVDQKSAAQGYRPAVTLRGYRRWDNDEKRILWRDRVHAILDTCEWFTLEQIDDDQFIHGDPGDTAEHFDELMKAKIEELLQRDPENKNSPKHVGAVAERKRIVQQIDQLYKQMNLFEIPMAKYYVIPEINYKGLKWLPIRVPAGIRQRVYVGPNFKPKTLHVYILGDWKEAFKWTFLGKDLYARTLKGGIPMRIIYDNGEIETDYYFPPNVSRDLADIHHSLVESDGSIISHFSQSSGTASDTSDGITGPLGTTDAGPVDDGAGLLPFTGDGSSGAGSSSPKSSPRSDSTDTSV